MSLIKTWRERRACFHHAQPTDGKPALSWIHSQLLDLGRTKMFRCAGCGRTWFV